MANQSETKPIPDCLRWLFTPLGRQFFLSCDWSVKSENGDGVYTSQRDPGMLGIWFLLLYFSFNFFKSKKKTHLNFSLLAFKSRFIFHFKLSLCGFPVDLPQLIPLPSCIARSAGSFWREPFTPLSSRRATLKQTNARMTLGKARIAAAVRYQETLAFYCLQIIFLFVYCFPQFSMI